MELLKNSDKKKYNNDWYYQHYSPEYYTSNPSYRYDTSDNYDYPGDSDFKGSTGPATSATDSDEDYYNHGPSFFRKLFKPRNSRNRYEYEPIYTSQRHAEIDIRLPAAISMSRGERIERVCWMLDNVCRDMQDQDNMNFQNLPKMRMSIESWEEDIPCGNISFSDSHEKEYSPKQSKGRPASNRSSHGNKYQFRNPVCAVVVIDFDPCRIYRYEQSLANQLTYEVEHCALAYGVFSVMVTNYHCWIMYEIGPDQFHKLTMRRFSRTSNILTRLNYETEWSRSCYNGKIPAENNGPRRSSLLSGVPIRQYQDHLSPKSKQQHFNQDYWPNGQLCTMVCGSINGWDRTVHILAATTIARAYAHKQKYNKMHTRNTGSGSR